MYEAVKNLEASLRLEMMRKETQQRDTMEQLKAELKEVKDMLKVLITANPTVQPSPPPVHVQAGIPPPPEASVAMIAAKTKDGGWFAQHGDGYWRCFACYKNITGTQGSSPIDHACMDKHKANDVYWRGKDQIQLAVDIKTDMESKNMKLARLMTAEESRQSMLMGR